jgi:hypothetical protein
MRDAILKAAAHLEANPGALSFMQGSVPKHYTYLKMGAACPLAWIGEFSTENWANHAEVAVKGMSIFPQQFYDRMTAITGSASKWMYNQAGCAKALRRYADKYYPAPRQEGIPLSIREIFDSPATWYEKFSALVT